MSRVLCICLLPMLLLLPAVAGLTATAPAATNFSIVYSQDERGAITPCG